MNQKCIHCEVPFNFYANGYLFIKTDNTNNITSKIFQHYSNNLYVLSYASLIELKEHIATFLKECSNIQDDLRAGLSKTKQPPFATYPFSTFALRIEHMDVVNYIQKGEFVSFLQPIMKLHNDGNDKIYGYESLLRAVHNPSVYHPGVLFPVAQNTGMHSLLDQRAREAAIKARVGQIERGTKSFINFLPSTIYNPDFCLQHTFQLVEKYNINAEDLVFEVVESEKIDDMEHLVSVLQAYKQKGMKVALDDVGSGFATLDVLTKLNPDYVKIDRSYISFCDQNKQNQQFLKNVLHIAKDLNIFVLAEGIERKEELEFCRSIGVHLAQGYYIGRPEKQALKQINY